MLGQGENGSNELLKFVEIVQTLEPFIHVDDNPFKILLGTADDDNREIGGIGIAQDMRR